MADRKCVISSTRAAVALGLVSLLGAAAGNAAEPDLGLAIGPGNLYPSIGITELYDDNIFRSQDDPKSSWISVVAPEALYELDGEIQTYRLALGFERGWYHASPADNYLDRHVGIAADFDPTPSLLAGLALDYNYGHEARGTGANEGAAATAVAGPDEFARTRLGAKLRYGTPDEQGASVLELSGDYLLRKYQTNRAATQFRDRTESRFSARLSYYVSPVTAVLVEGRVHDFDYELGANDNIEYAALVGARWEATALTTGYAKAGWKRKSFADSAFGSHAGALWEIGVQWKPLSYSTFDLSTARESEESNGTGDYIDVRSATLAWTHDWRPFLGSSLGVGVATQDYPGSTRNDDIRTLDLTLTYLSRWWLTLEAGYAYSKRDSTVAGLDFTDNLFTLGIRVAL